MSENTAGTKRAYHHSEAWLKKHAKKQMAKKLPKKRVAKKTATQKPTKRTLKTAVQVFNHAKKHVSGIKKCTKQIGKFFTEAMKTGDAKYIAKVEKLFKRIGYVYTPDSQFVTFENNAKVKLPKMAVAKATSPKVPRAKKIADVKPDTKENVPAEVQTTEAPRNDGKPSPELLILEDDKDLDNEDDFEELDMAEKREDESDEEFLERIEEEREIERDLAESEVDARDEIFAAQEENGDFS